MSSPKNKTILITGASSGIGKASAEVLSGKGYDLILIARRLDRLEALKNNLKTNITIAQVDITDNNQVNNFFSENQTQLKSLDVIINNAGTEIGTESAPETNLEDWSRMVDTNIKGLLNITNPILKIFKNNNSGHVINIGSVAASMPYEGGNVYGATKAFVRQFSQNLRLDFLGTNIKVTNIEPGSVRTELSSIINRGDKEKADNYYNSFRSLFPEDIASAIYWVINQPTRVNIDNIIVESIDETYGGIGYSKLSS